MNENSNQVPNQDQNQYQPPQQNQNYAPPSTEQNQQQPPQQNYSQQPPYQPPPQNQYTAPQYQIQPQDYNVFGGWLLVWYVLLIAGSVLNFLGIGLAGLFALGTSFFVGPIFGIGSLIRIAATIAFAIFAILTAMQMKARNRQFFDNFIMGYAILTVGSILASLLQIRTAFGVGNFIGSLIGTLIGAAVILGLYIMYLSKSARVKVYFGGRPLESSKFWAWIKLLPNFIISEDMPDPNRMQQMSSQQNQNYGQQQQNYQQPPQDYSQQPQPPQQNYSQQPPQDYSQPPQPPQDYSQQPQQPQDYSQQPPQDNQ